MNNINFDSINTCSYSLINYVFYTVLFEYPIKIWCYISMSRSFLDIIFICY